MPMPSITSLATPAEARALARVLPWDDQAGRLVSTIAGADRGAQTLGQYLDDYAAVFAVHGDGPIATRTLEPLTYLARHVEQDEVTMARIGALLTSIDDLPGPVDLRRVGFAASDQASAGLGLLGDLRRESVPAGTSREALDALIEQHLPATAGYARNTGYYQHGRAEFVLSPRVSRQVLHAGFEDPLSPLPELNPAMAARIAPHELVHGTQDWGKVIDPGTWSRVSEAGASIVGNLRAGTTLQAVGRTPVGLEAATMPSNYHPLSQVLSGLARLGGQNLDDPSHVARLEQRIAALEPPRLLESMSADAARWQGTNTLDMRNAVADGLLNGPAAFDARLGALGVATPDTSLGWMFTEARRRAGVTAAA
jgi:hypothetical protein